MIRIRYRDLSSGLHGVAECGGRRTTVYLLPGLTGGQRRAALRRLRQEASRGYGPALPCRDLAVALAADRFRTGLRNTAAVVRLHPAGSLLPTALVGALMTLFVLASMSARAVQPPQAPGAPGAVLAAAGSPAVAVPPAIAQVTPAGADASGATGPGGAGRLAGGHGGGQAKTRTDQACRTAPGGTAAAESAGADPALATSPGPACPPAPAPWQAVQS